MPVYITITSMTITITTWWVHKFLFSIIINEIHEELVHALITSEKMHVLVYVMYSKFEFRRLYLLVIVYCWLQPHNRTIVESLTGVAACTFLRFVSPEWFRVTLCAQTNRKWVAAFLLQSTLFTGERVFLHRTTPSTQTNKPIHESCVKNVILAWVVKQFTKMPSWHQ